MGTSTGLEGRQGRAAGAHLQLVQGRGGKVSSEEEPREDARLAGEGQMGWQRGAPSSRTAAGCACDLGCFACSAASGCGCRGLVGGELVQSDCQGKREGM